MRFLQLHFWKIIWLVFLLKLVLLPWTAHPFDFWTFVNTFERSALYGWNVFEFWNKGNFLILLWYPLYAFYLGLLTVLHLSADNILLLHFFFKVPFLLMDLLGGYLLFLSIKQVTGSTSQAKTSFLIWFLNPLPFYVYGIHGHYELIVPFSLILIYYGLVFRRSLPMALGLLLSFTTKYFVIVFFPFLLLYLLVNKQKRMVFLTTVFFLIGLILSYLHLINHPDFLRQTIQSVINLSSTNTGLTISKITIPPLNIFSALNFLFYPHTPINNTDNSTLFALASLNLKLSALLLFLHFCYRSVRVLVQKQEYTLKVLIIDLFWVITYLLLTLGNFQLHYLTWFLPFFIILLVDSDAYFLSLIPFSVIGFVLAFKNEVGPRTFFLDISPVYNTLLSLDRVDISTVYGLAFLIIASLLLALYLVQKEKKYARGFRLTNWYFIFMLATWSLMIVPYYRVLTSVNLRNLPKTLAYSGSTLLHPGSIYGNYQVQQIKNGELLFADDNQSHSLIAQQISQLPANLQSNFKLYFLFKNTEPSTFAPPQVGQLKFNNCPVEPLDAPLLNLNDYHNYPAATSSLQCLKIKDNQLTGLDPNLGKNDLELYIVNQKVSYLYAPSNRLLIHFLAVLGLLYCLGGALIAGFILRSLHKQTIPSSL